MMEFPNLLLIEAFIEIYRKRSITLAAKSLGLSKAAMTKRLRLLEEERGELLFRRSSRKIVPTPEGEVLYQKALRLLDSLGEFSSDSHKAQALEGTVRITATASMAHSCLTKLLMKFQKKHPSITIDLVVTDSYLDMVENNIDLALRIGNLPSSTLHGKRLAPNKTVVCATPTYLKKYGTPKTSSQLKDHALGVIPVHFDLKFQKSGERIKSLLKLQKIRTTDTQTLLMYALNHEIIVVRSYWHVKELVQNKKLQVILPDDELEDNGDIWLLSTTGRFQTKRVRALFDFLSEKLGSYLT